MNVYFFQNHPPPSPLDISFNFFVNHFPKRWDWITHSWKEEATSLKPDSTGTKHQSLRPQKLPALNCQFLSNLSGSILDKALNVCVLFSDRPLSHLCVMTMFTVSFAIENQSLMRIKRMQDMSNCFDSNLMGDLFAVEAFYRLLNCAFACLRVQRLQPLPCIEN